VEQLKIECLKRELSSAIIEKYDIATDCIGLVGKMGIILL